ncbi:MAG TPA: hypothetical protein VJP79_02970 [Nitrososphaera sp.]|nr:hypothetical protein [Nitrososphaera sp.]
MNYAEICHDIIELDRSIRFTAIASTEGKIVAAVYREGTQPLLTREESELSIMQSIIRMSIRKTLESKLGKALYAVAVYERVTRATVSLYNDGSKLDAYLMVSFDSSIDHHQVMTSKLFPYLRRIDKSTAK